MYILLYVATYLLIFLMPSYDNTLIASIHTRSNYVASHIMYVHLRAMDLGNCFQNAGIYNNSILKAFAPKMRWNSNKLRINLLAISSD